MADAFTLQKVANDKVKLYERGRPPPPLPLPRRSSIDRACSSTSSPISPVDPRSTHHPLLTAKEDLHPQLDSALGLFATTNAALSREPSSQSTVLPFTMPRDTLSTTTRPPRDDGDVNGVGDGGKMMSSSPAASVSIANSYLKPLHPPPSTRRRR